jgi:hypothetical protein
VKTYSGVLIELMDQRVEIVRRFLSDCFSVLSAVKDRSSVYRLLLLLYRTYTKEWCGFRSE